MRTPKKLDLLPSHAFALLLLVTPTVAINVARADLIMVVNPSFEDISGEAPVNEFTFGPFNGWQLYDPELIANGGAGGTFFVGTLTPNAPVFFNSGAANGQRVGIAFNYFGSGGLGEYGLQQTLTATLQPNRTYTLLVDIGNIASGTAVNGSFFPLAGFPGYRVDLIAGGQVIASDNNSLAGTIAEGTFATSQLQFTTGASHIQLGQALGIRLVNLNTIDSEFPSSDLEVDFDHVRLSAVTAVPEPSSMMFGLVAALALVASSRRHKEVVYESL